MEKRCLALCLLVALFFTVVYGEISKTEEKSTLELKLMNDELSIKSGEKLVMDMTVKNVSSAIVQTKSIKSRVKYTTLGNFVVNRTSIEWEEDLYPSEIHEGTHKMDLPLYTAPGTYTITIWIEYEGGKSEEVQLILHYQNYYVYIVLAVVINALILYGKKIYNERKSKEAP